MFGSRSIGLVWWQTNASKAKTVLVVESPKIANSKKPLTNTEELMQKTLTPTDSTYLCLKASRCWGCPRSYRRRNSDGTATTPTTRCSPRPHQDFSVKITRVAFSDHENVASVRKIGPWLGKLWKLYRGPRADPTLHPRNVLAWRLLVDNGAIFLFSHTSAILQAYQKEKSAIEYFGIFWRFYDSPMDFIDNFSNFKQVAKGKNSFLGWYFFDNPFLQ